MKSGILRCFTIGVWSEEEEDEDEEEEEEEDDERNRTADTFLRLAVAFEEETDDLLRLSMPYLSGAIYILQYNTYF